MIAASGVAAVELLVGVPAALEPAEHGIVKVEPLPGGPRACQGRHARDAAGSLAKQQPEADLDAVLRWEERRRDFVNLQSQPIGPKFIR